MANYVSMDDMYPIIADVLERDGQISINVTGISMQPMLYNMRDSVTLKKSDGKLKKYDLPLYKREDGKYILHRIIKVHKNGYYTCLGDNTWKKEYPVKPSQIIGVVTSFNRNGKEISVENKGYKLYVKTWKFFHPFKKFYKYVAPIIKK